MDGFTLPTTCAVSSTLLIASRSAMMSFTVTLLPGCSCTTAKSWSVGTDLLPTMVTLLTVYVVCAQADGAAKSEVPSSSAPTVCRMFQNSA